MVSVLLFSVISFNNIDFKTLPGCPDSVTNLPVKYPNYVT